METKYVRVPFEVELSKKITKKLSEGRIVTRNGENVRIVCFDRKSVNNKFPILALIETEQGEFSHFFNYKGYDNFDGLETKFDLYIEIPEYMTFKDGDVIAFGNNNDKPTIGIFQKDLGDYSHKCYVKLDCYGFLVYDAQPLTYANSRFATVEEIQKLIDALKASKEPKSYGYIKRFFGIEEKQKCEFKAGQPVIGIDGRGEWRYDLFSHYNPKYQNGNYVCSARSYSKCFPYNEKTVHLLGTTEDYKEE